MEKEKVSIIVAVYNVEPYLKRCLDSLLNQTYGNIELVLVDDGSTDRSPDICDEYARRDVRIKVIHKTNGGVSSARQAGLDACTGEWVIHADPDDFVDSDMVASLLDATKKSPVDMVTCDYYRNEKIVKQTYTNHKDLLWGMIEDNICFCLWNTLVRRSFIISNNVSFYPLWLSHSEDVLFVMRLLAAGARPIHVAKPFYHYINRGGSLVTTRSKRNLQSVKTVISELQKIIGDGEKEKLYNRKRYVFVYAYEGRWFKELKGLYPEIRSRLAEDYNDDWLSINSQLARCMKYPPILVWSTAKFCMYVNKFISKIRWVFSKK